LHGGRLEDEGKNIYPHGAILYQLILVWLSYSLAKNTIIDWINIFPIAYKFVMVIARQNNRWN
jgi:hypothetical protein